MSDILRQTIQQNLAGKTTSLPSVCSAHPEVLLASLLLAQELDQPIIIEATSNQVNQDGGYTGMQPADFVAFVKDIASGIGFDSNHIIFGGDHLGPQVWRGQPAEAAMAKAAVLVAEYVKAGFTKIHLDCSEGCKGEPAQVDDATSANRAAQLAKVCEQASTSPENLSYMVGTEVPPPGGARGDESETLQITNPEAAIATMLKHYEAFDAAGIPEAKQKIVALVVQPGVEFSADHIDHLPVGGNAELRSALNGFDGVCFEAHSTDYQHPQAYQDLANMGFAIHKIGPALTFAYRKAIYSLGYMGRAMGLNMASVPEVMEALMLKNPAFWTSHYHGDEQALKTLRHFSYADRIRYYWAQPEASAAVSELQQQIDKADIPELVWQQFFSDQNRQRANTLISAGYSLAQSAVLAEIQLALVPYFINVKKG